VDTAEGDGDRVGVGGCIAEGAGGGGRLQRGHRKGREESRSSADMYKELLECCCCKAQALLKGGTVTDLGERRL
jgi:hypothetical protein